MKRIGITAFYMFDVTRRMSLVDRQYSEAIISTGCLPVIIPVVPDINLAEEYIEGLDGLLITGGCDVCPVSYNEEPEKEVRNFSLERDRFETALIKAAIKKHIPIMGVCRGMQMINVALGGNIIQHIPSDVKNAICHVEDGNEQWEPCHSVKILPSCLSPIFGEKAFVNSYHHQAVKNLGEGLKGIAYAPDGICEAYEDRERKILGIQWHPEKLFHHYEDQRMIFETFVNL